MSRADSEVCACQASVGTCIVSSVAGVYGDMWGDDGPEEVYETGEVALKRASDDGAHGGIVSGSSWGMSKTFT